MVKVKRICLIQNPPKLNCNEFSDVLPSNSFICTHIIHMQFILKQNISETNFVFKINFDKQEIQVSCICRFPVYFICTYLASILLETLSHTHARTNCKTHAKQPNPQNNVIFK